MRQVPHFEAVGSFMYSILLALMLISLDLLISILPPTALHKLG